MAQSDAFRGFKGTGMDADSALENIAPNDIISAVNMRFTGTAGQEDTYGTNIESNEALAGSLLPGINNVIGGGKFDDTAQILAFRYNTGGNNQILLYDDNTKTYKVIFTDITDSDGIAILPLNPQNEVLAILVNDTYAIWWAKDLEPGYTNLITLANGGYGTILPEDLSLLKPQCLIPPTGVYGNDAGQPANYLYGNLPQFIVQWVNADFNYSTWSTWSKRIVPYQENTPTLGSNVGLNNYIIVSVNIGSIRATVINIGCRFGTQIFAIVKSVDRAYVTALPNTSVNVYMEIYEAYDPTTNLYSFAFYNNDISVPIAPPETDLFVDYIWPSNAGALVNGNIAALADWKTLYARPQTSVTIAAVGYDPNISIPAGTYSNPFIKVSSFPGESGSGAGDHKRKMSITFGGIPRTGDTILVVIADIRNANFTITYPPYVVPSGQDGNLVAVTASFSEEIPGSNFYDNGDGTTTINWVGPPYYGLQTFSIELFFAGASVANSVPTVLDNTSLQVALGYRDSNGRPFPIDTDNTFIVTTPSYAQVNGLAIEITVQINTLNAPKGAVDYLPIITKPPIIKILDVMGCILAFKGTWDAYANSPLLSVNSGNIGDTYQITAPADPSDPTHYKNLGTGEAYKTGDYITNVGGTNGSAGAGQSYAVLPKTFGNLAGQEILALSLNPLNLFNADYSQDGVSSILVYDYAVGDRCTFHYWVDSDGNINYFNAPCINVAVLGYDAGTYIVKLEKSAAFTYASGHIYYNGNQIDVRNIFFRLYSPAEQTQTASVTQNETVWYEVGQRYTITNGVHDVLNFIINDGGAYYKTRQYADAIQPYANPPLQTLSTDFNYSDFYPSAFSSFGRPRTYYDVLEQTEQKASIITSQNYILGSKNNGLNRFYPANIYGEGNGQTSSSKGAIQIMWQRGQQLVVGQELDFFYIPVNEAYTVLNEQITGQSISEKLLNNGRYETRGIGIGTAKESFCTRYEVGFFIDPFKSLPMRIGLDGVEPIAGKMSKYFKATLQAAYQMGKKLHQFYNDYYEEVVLCIQAESGILIFYPFSLPDWQVLNDYVIEGTDVTETPDGAHCTASYDPTTGLVTYIPTDGYVGNDVATFTFLIDGEPITVNNCLTWTAGSSVVNPFSFAALINQPVSTLLESNSVLIGGNTIPSPISISAGGEYSEDNGVTWTSASGTVPNGAIVKVRVMSSASFSTETHTDLTVGTETERFSVTTASSTPTTSNIEIDNNSTDFGITSTTLRTGPTDYTYGTVSPGDSLTSVIDIGTYTVHVNVVGLAGINGTLTINGTDHALSGGGMVTQSGVTSPILITLVDAP